MHFLQPTALWGLLALAIPVVVHLFNFQRTEKIFFSNTRLLRNVIQKTNKTKTVQNRLLLLNRMLILAALVLAFAQPRWGNTAEEKEAGGPMGQNQLVFLDNSPSMFWPDDGNRAFEKAQALARSLAPSTGSRGWYNLLTHDFLSRHTWTSGKAFGDQVMDIGPSQESRSLSTLTNRAVRQLDLAPEKLPATLHLVSDFQKGQAGDPESWRLDSAFTWVLHPISHKETYNLWIDSVWLTRPVAAGLTEAELQIRIGHSLNSQGKTARVQLLANGNLVGGQVVNLSSTDHTPASVKMRIRPGETLRTEVVLDDPEITTDNRFFLVLHPPQTLGVYHIREGSDTRMANVFRPLPVFSFQAGNPGQVDFPALEKASLILVETENSPGEGILNEITRKAAEGATVCFIPKEGSTWLPAFMRNSGISIEPISRTEPAQSFQIALPRDQDPFFNQTLLPGEKNPRKPFAKPVFQIPGANAVLSYESGDGFATRVSRGEGRFFVLAAPLFNSLENFSQHPLMIALFYKMAFSAQASENPSLYTLPGQSDLILPLDSLSQNGREWQVSLENGSEKWASVIRRAGKTLRLALPNEGLKPGFWKVIVNGKEVATIAGNGSRLESKPEFYTAEELREKFKTKPWIRVEGLARDASSEYILAGKKESWPLWKFLILIAVLGLGLEAYLLRKQEARLSGTVS